MANEHGFVVSSTINNHKKALEDQQLFLIALKKKIEGKDDEVFIDIRHDLTEQILNIQTILD